jgi:excisionase family DNA binding protein
VKVITVLDASKMLKVSRQRVTQHINNGRLKAEKIGCQWLLLESDVKAFKPLKSGRPKRKGVI